MKTLSRPIRQRGIVAVMAVIFLITAVIFVLTQTLNITGTTSIDNSQQRDSVAALFAAESGLERAINTVKTGDCAAVNQGDNSSSGSDTNLTYSLASVGPEQCGAGCTQCRITSTGAVNSARRTITYLMQEKIEYGKSGIGQSVEMKLQNIYGDPAIGVYNVGILGQGASISIDTCQYKLASGLYEICGANFQQWNTQASSSGAEKNNDMGVVLPLSGDKKAVKMTFNASYRYALVGGLFPGVGTIPTKIGSYAKDIGSDGSRTVHSDVASSPSYGETIGGVGATGDWCAGADTLVFGVSAKSQLASNISGVNFNTAGAEATNVALERLVYFPLIDSPDVDIYSMVFFTFNPNLISAAHSAPFVVGVAYKVESQGNTSFTSIGASSNLPGTIFSASGAGSGTGTAMPVLPYAFNASSYQGDGTGAIGASWTGAGNTIAGNANVVNAAWDKGGNTCGGGQTGNCASGTTLYVGNFTKSQSNQITAGATISSSGGSGNITGSPTVVKQIVPLATGEVSGGIGRYELSLSQTVTASNGRNWTATGNIPVNLTNAVMTVTTFNGYPSQIISKDDVVSTDGANGVLDVIIDGQITPNAGIGEVVGGKGRYNLIGTVANSVPNVSTRIWTAKSKILNISSCILCGFVNINPGAGVPISGLIANTKISTQLTPYANEAVGGVGRYNLKNQDGSEMPTTQVSSADTLRAGNPGNTIYIRVEQPAPSTVPAVVDSNHPKTKVAVFSGIGAFTANTTVETTPVLLSGNAVKSFTVSTSPNPILNRATICAGVCALFGNRSNAASVNQFKVISTNTSRWGGGFTCLKGIDRTKIEPIYDQTVTNIWKELVN